jgi:alkylation response protein AidB-like acyl-CoA dehydrogenase
MNSVPIRVDDDLVETLARYSEKSEADRRLAPESVAAMRDAGLFRALVPARVGGAQMSLRDMSEMVIRASAGCSAAGWVLMVSLAHDFALASFPEQAQDEVWADGADGVTPGSLAPGGTLEPADGGWTLNGRWPFNSGAHHGAWFLLGAVDRSGSVPVLHHVVVGRDDLVLDDDWHALGLRGTGSVDAEAREVFVPDHRALDSRLLLGAKSEWARRHSADVYRIPLLPALAAHLAAAAIGIAKPAIEKARAMMRDQRDRYTGQAKSDRAGLQMRLAQATTGLRAAELLHRDVLDLLQDIADGADSPENRAVARYRSAYIVENCRLAVDRVAQATGARSAFDASPIQRSFRDITMASRHELANLDGNAVTFGRILLGLDPGDVPL